MGTPEAVIAVFFLCLMLISAIVIYKFIVAAVRSGTKQAMRDNKDTKS